MRLPGSEKLEIIRLVEQSHLPARRTLEMLGIQPSTFYRWYDRYRAGGPEALEDKPSRPDRVWNRIPDDIRERIVAMALEIPELSPRELATRFIDAPGFANYHQTLTVVTLFLGAASIWVGVKVWRQRAAAHILARIFLLFQFGVACAAQFAIFLYIDAIRILPGAPLSEPSLASNWQVPERPLMSRSAPKTLSKNFRPLRLHALARI